ncbi:spore photoproduct lyase family protein [Amycolatopsis sp. NPDC051371]|uniref:spore photoproduct lyase family protein n=1 Tax=Amycolatopsis sp. NPDC051371 TaxID=3155800 RepID=UPI0034245A65
MDGVSVEAERERLLAPSRIYVEPAAAELPRGRQVLARFPDATRVEIDSHWQIPELHGDETNVRRWVRIKREALVLGVKKSLTARPNGRSADFIAPSTSNGCAMARTSSGSSATCPATSAGRASSRSPTSVIPRRGSTTSARTRTAPSTPSSATTSRT